MKSFFEEVFGDSFGRLFDFPFTEKETNDEDMHSYFHSISEKYKNGKRVSHVEKEVKDGKVLKDVKEEPKLQVIDKPIDLFESCVSPSDEVKNLREEYEEEMKKLKEDHISLTNKYNELVNRLDAMKDENDKLKVDLLKSLTTKYGKEM